MGVKVINEELCKEEKIKREIRNLNKIFKDIPVGKKKLVSNLIQNAAFMAVTLSDLQEQINEEGPVCEVVNGNGFRVMQEHPAQKSYIAMIARYNSTISQLTNLLPDAKQDATAKAGESLVKFIAQGKPKA